MVDGFALTRECGRFVIAYTRVIVSLVCITTTAAVAPTNAAAAGAPLGSPISPPMEEQGAVALSGRTANPATEAWERLEAVTPRPKARRSAKVPQPERWVRNVSVPTLSAFLPPPGHRSGAAMVVLPGGGFMHLSMDLEGYSVAHWLNGRGIAAFVLKYRLAPMPEERQAYFRAEGEILARAQERIAQITSPVTAYDALPELRDAMLAAGEDAAEAVRYVRAHASQWAIAPHRIGVVGFSAGGVLALGVALHADEASRADLVAPIYGLLQDSTPVPASAPAAFVAVAADDAFASGGSVAIYQAWRAVGRPAELHVFEGGGHGFGLLKQGKRSDQWPRLFDAWLRAHGFESSRER